MIMSSLDSSIEQEIKKLNEATSHSAKLQHLNNVIQMKHMASSRQFNRELYLDVKLFLKYYVLSRDENQFNYDELRFTDVQTNIQLADVHQQVRLIKYLVRLLRIHGYDDEMPDLENEMARAEIRSILASKKITALPKLLFYLTTYNVLTIIASCLVYLGVIYVLLLPAPSWSVQIFRISYHPFTDNYPLNHLLNILSGPLSLAEEFKVEAVNCWGFVLMLLGKIIFIVFILSVLFNNLEKKLKL